MKSMQVMKQRAQSGFTLIELMIVVAIVGILAAVAIPQYQDYVTRSKLAKAATFVAPLKTAMATYAQENAGGFPAAIADGGDFSPLGLSAAPADTTEVSAVSTAADGTITITLQGIGGSYDGATVAYAPTVNSTTVNWATTCSYAHANMTKVFGC